MLDYGVMFLGPVPMAFVNLPSRDLAQASFGSKIRIITAGVWHNLVLALMALALLALMPALLSPFYAHSSSGSGKR